jgi:diguanylate cyclase (GGDEF)-like protein
LNSLPDALKPKGNLLAEKTDLEVLQVLLARGKLAFAWIDPRLRIETVSANFQEFLHLPHPVEGQALDEVFDALVGAEQTLNEVLCGQLPEYRLEYVNYEQADFRGYITLNLWRHTLSGGQAGFLLVVEDVSVVARLEQRAVQTRNELQLLRLQLERTNAELERQALFDALTGLPNRRYLESELDRQVEFSIRHGTALIAMLIDIDDFHALNEAHGHSAGDQSLRILASTIRASIRVTDFVARSGSDEFGVFLPMAEPAQAVTLARRLQTALAGKNAHLSAQFTVSIGVAGASPKGPPLAEDSLLQQAAQALAQAKREGKNRICVF